MGCHADTHGPVGECNQGSHLFYEINIFFGVGGVNFENQLVLWTDKAAASLAAALFFFLMGKWSRATFWATITVIAVSAVVTCYACLVFFFFFHSGR